MIKGKLFKTGAETTAYPYVKQINVPLPIFYII